MKLAYAAYAGKVPSTAMVVLAYMALVSKDDDPEPWFGQGHEALAEYALGRAAPLGVKDVRAVERAIAPLLEVGAIVADRRPAPRSGGGRTVRYRLILGYASSPRKPVGDEAGQPDAPRKPVDERPTETVRDVPRNPSERPTKSVQTSHGNRGTEEEEETRGEAGGVSQSAGEREAARWLHGRYGLTDHEAAQVVAEARRRAPEPIKHLVPYLDGMTEGDLADVVAAVMDNPDPAQPPLTAVPGKASGHPPATLQHPLLTSVPDTEPPTSTDRDERGLPAGEERQAARARCQEINTSRAAR